MWLVKATAHFMISQINNFKISSFARFCQSSTQIIHGIPEFRRRYDFFTDFIEHRKQYD